MEQNLNERERYIRLGIGLVLAAATIYSSFRAENIYFTLGLGLAALGFIAKLLYMLLRHQKNDFQAQILITSYNPKRHLDEPTK